MSTSYIGIPENSPIAEGSIGGAEAGAVTGGREDGAGCNEVDAASGCCSGLGVEYVSETGSVDFGAIVGS